ESSTESVSPIKSPLLRQTQHELVSKHPTGFTLEGVANMAPALQVAMDFGGGEMQALSRADLLNRYRHYSAIRRYIQTSAFEIVATSRLLAHAKRVGLSAGEVR